MDSTASRINANSFWGASIESPDVVEYHLDCAGNDNYFMNCRWENTGSGARVMWREGSIGNMISQGFGSHTIVETKGTANRQPAADSGSQSLGGRWRRIRAPRRALGRKLALVVTPGTPHYGSRR